MTVLDDSGAVYFSPSYAVREPAIQDFRTSEQAFRGSTQIKSNQIKLSPPDSGRVATRNTPRTLILSRNSAMPHIDNPTSSKFWDECP